MACDIAFLGFADKSLMNPTTTKLNLVGLSPILATYIFPFDLNGRFMVLAIRGVPTDPVKLTFVWSSGEVLGSFTLEPEGEVREVSDTQFSPWTMMPIPLSIKSLPVDHPGEAILKQTLPDGSEVNIGLCEFVQAEGEEYSEPFLAALKLDPRSTKLVRIVLHCKSCLDRVGAYVGIERNPELEASGFYWFRDLPDKFHCGCGRFSPDLTSIKRNLHVYLKASSFSDGLFVAEPAYLPEDIKRISTSFRQLLDSDPREEVVQQFIEHEPLLLHQIPAKKMWVKPPVLTKYKCDFAILTPQKILYLIEIEAPSRRLLVKGGDRAGDLNHAIDQVTDWLHHANEHRGAFLDGLGLSKDDVANIEGVVVMGRDGPYDAERLRKLKGTTLGAKLITYDDLLESIDLLSTSLMRAPSVEFLGYGSPSGRLSGSA